MTRRCPVCGKEQSEKLDPDVLLTLAALFIIGSGLVWGWVGAGVAILIAATLSLVGLIWERFT